MLAAAAALADGKPGLLHTPAQTAKANEAHPIEGSLVNAQTIDKVIIKYRGPGEDYSDARMELQYGDLFRGSIPAAQMAPPGVEYYVEGLTFEGARVPLFASATKPARVLVLREPGGEEEAPPPKK